MKFQNERNIEEAKKNYEMATRQKYPPAQCALGEILYEEGDAEKAKYWLKKAFKQKYPLAQFVLSYILCYEDCISIQQIDHHRGLKDYTQAICILGDIFLCREKKLKRPGNITKWLLISEMIKLEKISKRLRRKENDSRHSSD